MPISSPSSLAQKRQALAAEPHLSPTLRDWHQAQLDRQEDELLAHARQHGAAEVLAANAPAAPASPLERERRATVSLLHPATRMPPVWLAPFMTLVVPGKLARLQPLSLYTDDHVQLDAVVLLPPGENFAAPGGPPTLVMAVGGSESYEYRLPTMLERAHDLDIQILLYNGRGIGRSLGEERSTHDEVADCSAAVRAACRLSSRVAVEGFSLGGAVSAKALQQLARAARLPYEIGLYINQHSFADLVTWRACLRAAQGSAEHEMLRKSWQDRLEALDFDRLDAAAALADTRLAHQVVCTTALQDRLVPHGARLQDVCRQRGSTPVNAVNRITWVERHTHHADTTLCPEVRQALQVWRATESRSATQS